MADDFLNYAFDYWLRKGYAPHQAAALAGQAQWEGGGNPSAVGDSGTAKGVYQWRLDRQQRLNQRPDAQTVPGQLDFADWELNNTEKGAGEALRNAKDYTEATNAVLGFLRPQGYTQQNPMGAHGYAQRYNLGAGLLNQPQMAQVLAMPPTQQVGAAPGMVPADVVAATQPDPRTAGDADLGGYGGSQKIDTSTADASRVAGASSKLTGMGMGLLAAGDAPTPQTQAWMQQAMNAGPGQAHRPQMPAGGLLTDIFKDPEEEKRRRMMAGLLGEG